MSYDDIGKNVLCCSCDGTLTTSKFINLVDTRYKATWEFPTGGNFLLNESGFALAFICDECADNKKLITKVVEFPDDTTKVIYHPIASMKEA